LIVKVKLKKIQCIEVKKESNVLKLKKIQCIEVKKESNVLSDSQYYIGDE